MRAVRARLDALIAGLTGFLVFLTVMDGFFVVCGVFWAVFWTGFFFVVEEACPAGLVVEPPEVCPATGDTVNKKESRPARQREASLETEVGEDVTIISSL